MKMDSALDVKLKSAELSTGMSSVRYVRFWTSKQIVNI